MATDTTPPQTDTPQNEPSAPPKDEQEDSENTLYITLKFHSHPITLVFPTAATLTDLSATVFRDLHIPPTNQKFLVSGTTPKLGLLRPPFKDNTAHLPLSSLTSAKITLLGSTAQQVADIDETISAIRSRQAARTAALRAARKVQPYNHRDARKIQEESTYTFATLRPLAHLRNPEKSLRFLERLRDDPGVKAAMRKHRFSVGLLTEMDPAMHTTHEGKTLGLNRNRGEVIELRLRTDAYDGYRDYKTIRRTLAHELAHNVVGPHNAEFHALWNQIEGEIDRNDYSRGGKTVGAEEFYNPADEGYDEDLEADKGGWVGGAYVLGGSSSESTGAPMDRREVIAKAAEERAKQASNLAAGKKVIERDEEQQHDSSSTN